MGDGNKDSIENHYSETFQNVRPHLITCGSYEGNVMRESISNTRLNSRLASCT